MSPASDDHIALRAWLFSVISMVTDVANGAVFDIRSLAIGVRANHGVSEARDCLMQDLEKYHKLARLIESLWNAITGAVEFPGSMSTMGRRLASSRESKCALRYLDKHSCFEVVLVYQPDLLYLYASSQ